MSTNLNFKAIRQHLHAHPELSGEEMETARFVAETLQTLAPDVLLENVGGTGVLATFVGNQPGEHLLFRAELDALPIQETNAFEYVSTQVGKAHLCGHDGHTTILLATAYKLKDGDFKGKVSFIFQPAEETGKGAQKVLADGRFQENLPDKVVAIHNLPSFELGTIVYKSAYFTASVKSIALHFFGKTSHASEPENGQNPALVIAQLIQAAASLNRPDVQDEDFCLATLVHCVIGEKAYGVSAGYGELHFTCRSWKTEVLDQLLNQLIDQAHALCQQAKLELTYEFLEAFEACYNNESVVQKGLTVAQQQGLTVQSVTTPFKFGEDFGLFTRLISGAMFGFGAGISCPALHNPDYDFPDELIEIVSDFFVGMVR